MASGAVLRRNKLISEHLNVSAYCNFRPHNLGHGHSTELRAFASFTHDHKNDNPAVAVNWGLHKLGLYRSSFYGNCKLEFPRTASQFIRLASTTTQPNLDNEQNRQELAAKKIMDSDQAVAFKVLRRVWTTISAIGPTLKYVANMDRDAWIYKIDDWKLVYYSLDAKYVPKYELLFKSVKLNMWLLVKIFHGESLSKRKRQLLTQTAADIFLLVPVSVYIVVPFIEFMLPVFLKLFPSMLPLTSQDKIKQQKALNRKVKGLNARIEFAVFLQDTARAMTKLDVQKTVWDYDRFVNYFRRTIHVSDEDILCFARLFNDELTLDNISISQIVNMCNCMEIPPCGTDEYLRFMLRKRLKLIKKDDKLIKAKGVESLSEAELRKYCRERGIHSDEEMRQQLYDWLVLSLNHNIPSSLLIISRSFTIAGKSRPEEAILATIDSFSYDLVFIAGARSLPSPDPSWHKRRRIESLRIQKKLVEKEERDEKMISEMKQYNATQDDRALKEMTIPTANVVLERDRASTGVKQEKLCEISPANAAFASALPVITECEKFLMLVKEEINLINSVHDKEGGYDKIIAMKADRASREENDQDAGSYINSEVSSVLTNRADAMLQNLEKEIDDVDAEIGYRWRGLDRYCDGTVSPEVVAAAALYLKDTMGEEGIQKLISTLSKDNDFPINPNSAPALPSSRISPSAPLVQNFPTGTASSSMIPQQHWYFTGVKPSESDLEVGLDFHHWRVLVEEPVGDPTRDQIIDSYIDILATVVGSKADARLKIYSVSTKYYFEFGALVPEDVAAKLLGVPYVVRLIPDMYYSVGAGCYGGESL